MLNFKHGVFTILLLSMFASTSFATFDVYNEDDEGYYGSGQTRPFKDAVENTDSLSSSDIAFLESVEETRTTDRYYGRVMVGKSKISLNNLTNNSSSFIDSFVLSTGSVNDNLYQLLIAGGHIWQQWAVELEVLLSKKMNFSMTPVLLGAAPGVIGTVGGTYLTSNDVQLNQYALSLNVQYVIPRWFSFYPRRLQVHLDAGVGVALLDSNVTGTALDPAIQPGLENTSERSYPAVGMLGIGARYQVTTHFLTGVAYRFYDFGKSSYGPTQNIKFQSNQLRESGFFVDVTYQV